MRSLFIFILFGFFIVLIYCRPSHSDQNSGGHDEIDYEVDSGNPSEEVIEASRYRESGHTGQEQNRRLSDLSRYYLQKDAAEDEVESDLDIAEYKPTRAKGIRNEHSNQGLNDEFRSNGNRRQIMSSRYTENNDDNEQSEMPQHLANRDVNNYKNRHNNQILDNPSKRAESRTEEGDLLFEPGRKQMSKLDKSDFNSESFEINDRPALSKQYYNRAENREMLTDNRRNNNPVYYNRDRRAAKKSNAKVVEEKSEEAMTNDSLEKAENESEEMAIRRQIKKLSESELEELFDSLSEEKRTLLKKIIDDTAVSDITDGINKREITKKSGAVEDNGYFEFGQSESSKVQGASTIDVSTESPSPNSELSETTKQADGTILSNKCSQDTNSEGKVELNNNNGEKSETSLKDVAPNADTNNNQAQVAFNEQVTSKKDDKRETKVEASVSSVEDNKRMNNENSEQSQDTVGYFSTQDEDLSQFDDDDSSPYDVSNIYKRDIEKQSELDSQLKSLEESFPNPESYDDPAPYSGPLVRVKRTNNKRAAGIMPDSKVAFFPNNESDDEYNEEGSEFEDDGFYDPSPNFVSKESKNIDTNSQQAGGEGANCILNTVNHAKTPNADTNSGTISLGSDTDNVLSGVEGVDENLMLSGNRNRRKSESDVLNEENNNFIQAAYASNKDDAVKDNNSNIPNYQESDSFGGLPHNYEGDLGRYKRIRRVKESSPESTPSDA